jgi:group I intron endonuclease
VNGKSYVGKTTKSIQERFTVHCYNATKRNDTTYLYKAIRKYGVENFIVELLDSTSDKMDDVEKYWIKELNTLIPNGYNMTEGGDGGDMSMSPNFLPSLKKRPIPLSTYGMKGKQHSDNTKNLQAVARKKHWNALTLEERVERGEKISGQNNGMFGKKPKNCVPISYMGVKYDSVSDASKKTGRSVPFLKKHGVLHYDDTRESPVV